MNKLQIFMYINTALIVLVVNFNLIKNDEFKNSWFPIFNGDYDDFNSLWY
jgi:hypothetical protein